MFILTRCGFAGVAQLVEQLICNQQVTGSSPIASSRRCAGRIVVAVGRGPDGEVPKRSNGADCKSAGYAFGGSNPPLSTTTAWATATIGFGEHQEFSRRSVASAIRAGIAQLARARAFQARGRGFESRFPLHATRAATSGPRSSGGRARPW